MTWGKRMEDTRRTWILSPNYEARPLGHCSIFDTQCGLEHCLAQYKEYTALHYPVVPKFSPVALLSQIAGIFFSLLMATELAPQGNVVPNIHFTKNKKVRNALYCQRYTPRIIEAAGCLRRLILCHSSADKLYEIKQTNKNMIDALGTHLVTWCTFFLFVVTHSEDQDLKMSSQPFLFLPSDLNAPRRCFMSHFRSHQLEETKLSQGFCPLRSTRTLNLMVSLK